MANVDVSKDALISVKDSVVGFQGELEKVSAHVPNHADEVLSDCKQSLKKQEDIVTELTKKYSEIKKELDVINGEIEGERSKISQYQGILANANQKISQLESEIGQLRSQKSQLEGQLASEKDDDKKAAISSQIAGVESQISAKESDKESVKRQKTTAASDIASAEQKISTLKNQKYQKETELSAVKNEIFKAQEKYEKLTNAYRSVEQEVQAVRDEVKTFSTKTKDSTRSILYSIKKCIEYIDAYESDNIQIQNGAVYVNGEYFGVQENISVSEVCGQAIDFCKHLYAEVKRRYPQATTKVFTSLFKFHLMHDIDALGNIDATNWTNVQEELSHLGENNRDLVLMYEIMTSEIQQSGVDISSPEYADVLNVENIDSIIDIEDGFTHGDYRVTFDTH